MISRFELTFLRSDLSRRNHATPTNKMTAGSRSLPMASRSGMELSWPWTPPLSHPSLETRDGQPRRRAGRFAGAALQDARRSKERTYPDLLNNQRCRLVVLAIEVGGRWSEEAAHHPPTKRCGRSHRTVVRHVDPCSHDPLRSHPSSPFLVKLHPISTTSTPIRSTGANFWRKPRRTLLPPVASPPCLSIPGPWTFALRARRVPRDCPVKQSEPQTDEEKGAEGEKKKTRQISTTSKSTPHVEPIPGGNLAGPCLSQPISPTFVSTPGGHRSKKVSWAFDFCSLCPSSAWKLTSKRRS